MARICSKRALAAAALQGGDSAELAARGGSGVAWAAHPKRPTPRAGMPAKTSRPLFVEMR